MFNCIGIYVFISNIRAASTVEIDYKQTFRLWQCFTQTFLHSLCAMLVYSHVFALWVLQYNSSYVMHSGGFTPL